MSVGVWFLKSITQDLNFEDLWPLWIKSSMISRNRKKQASIDQGISHHDAQQAFCQPMEFVHMICVDHYHKWPKREKTISAAITPKRLVKKKVATLVESQHCFPLNRRVTAILVVRIIQLMVPASSLTSSVAGGRYGWNHLPSTLWF